MQLAGNQEGQANVNMFEFIDSGWFKTAVKEYFQGLCNCWANINTGNALENKFFKDAKLFLQTEQQTKQYIQWANSHIDEFIKDYRGYIAYLCGNNPDYVPQSVTAVARVHKTIVMKELLQAWLDRKLNRDTNWIIDNTDPLREYNVDLIRERYGIGKKHYTEEDEKAAKANSSSNEGNPGKSNGKAKPYNRFGIPGIRTLSPSDLELF